MVWQELSRSGVRLALSATLSAGLFGMYANAQSLPDPSVCEAGEDWIEVAKAFIIALPAAHAAGRITDQQFTELSIWTTQMQTYLMNTNNKKVICEQFLAVRLAWGF